MSRYIDADKIEYTERYVGMDEFAGWQTIAFKSDIDKIPTADVVEVRHGTWYHGNDGGAIYAKCSACGRKMNYSCYGYAYCCLCGARMDGERSEGDDLG
jgi:hypothetical protein